MICHSRNGKNEIQYSFRTPYRSSLRADAKRREEARRTRRVKAQQRRIWRDFKHDETIKLHGMKEENEYLEEGELEISAVSVWHSAQVLDQWQPARWANTLSQPRMGVTLLAPQNRKQR